MATLQIGAPGVPPLLGGINIALPQLLTADTFTGYGSPQQSQWGVYLNGAPALVFDSFVSVDYRRGWALSDYPVERGGFQTYDKVQLPFDIRVKFATGSSLANREAMIAAMEQVSKSLLLYSVVTPEQVFPSVNVQHIDYHRTATNGQGLIVVEMWLLEVRVTITNGSDNTGADGQVLDATGNPVQSPQVGGVDSVGNNTVDASGSNPVASGSVVPGSMNLDVTSVFAPGAGL